MKSTLLSSLYCLLMLVSVGIAGGHRDKRPPKAPGLTYLYTVNITGGELYPVGNGPRGIRLVVPILSGNFEGPKLKGELIHPLNPNEASAGLALLRKPPSIPNKACPQERSCPWAEIGL